MTGNGGPGPVGDPAGSCPGNHPLYRYATTGMGLKFRIHPLAAAIALDQLNHLDEVLDGRETMARFLIDELRGTPGVGVPDLPTGSRAAWYGLPLRYRPEELDELPVERFYRALWAERCHEVDRPGATCPQFNFTVQVTATEPVTLTEHDGYRWASLTEEPPVTDAVKDILAQYRASLA